MIDAADDGLGLTPEERWGELEALQEAYPDFEPFLYDVVVGLLGFDCTWLQLDIADYLARGPLYRMVQAQRGQAKTTITAAYAVWRQIHNPSARVLVISAGDTQATEIANWVIQIIMNMPELRCLRPDKAHGDRASVKAFDVHWVLKGPEKSPSIACIGITSNMQGKRADILIADDIESSKNSQTATQRERLAHLTKDFSSICSTGDIIYLGTPQSIESVYNSLASRGFDIRIWPGRYPTHDEEQNYGTFLAPEIRARMEADTSLRTGGGALGTRGKPTDPELINEMFLQKKERDQGTAYFQLQHMLDTRLTDKDRFPLRPSNIVFSAFGKDRAPLELNFLQSPEYRLHTPPDFPIEAPLYRSCSHGAEFGTFDNTTVMYVDPSGGGANGDELAWAVTKFMAGKIYLCDFGGTPGGYSDHTQTVVLDVAEKNKVSIMHIEENFGKGAFAAILRPKLAKRLPTCGIEEIWESGQKELRIIDTLEPILSSNLLVVHPDLIGQDMQLAAERSLELRKTYSLFYQMARITRDRGSLIHDDRLDAVAGACRFWTSHLQLNEERAKAAAQQAAYAQMVSNPLGDGRPLKNWKELTGAMHTSVSSIASRKVMR